MGNTKVLYHTGFDIIKEPDVKVGRSNADFGQGFYLSDDGEFSRRWAKDREKHTTFINKYELDLDGLKVKQFSRNDEWFDYIYRNRAGQADKYLDYDVIIGPIANDTIYDTCGITTSGMLSNAQALLLLLIGKEYTQIALKSEKAASALRFVEANEITKEEIAAYRKTVSEEEEVFLDEFAKVLDKI